MTKDEGRRRDAMALQNGGLRIKKDERRRSMVEGAEAESKDERRRAKGEQIRNFCAVFYLATWKEL
jgi:hypothetical protein